MKIQRSYEDAYQYQLYLLSKSKKRSLGRWVGIAYGVILLVFAINSGFRNNDYEQAGMFAGIVLVCFAVLFWGRPYLMRRNVLTAVKKAYAPIEGRFYELVPEAGGIHIVEEGRDIRLAAAEFSQMIEVDDYYFLQLQETSAYVIPKLFSGDEPGFVAAVEGMGIPVVREHWKGRK